MIIRFVKIANQDNFLIRWHMENVAPFFAGGDSDCGCFEPEPFVSHFTRHPVTANDSITLYSQQFVWCRTSERMCQGVAERLLRNRIVVFAYRLPFQWSWKPQGFNNRVPLRWINTAYLAISFC